MWFHSHPSKKNATTLTYFPCRQTNKHSARNLLLFLLTFLRRSRLCPHKPADSATPPRQGEGLLLWMDEIRFAPPKKPWHDDSPVTTNQQWFPMVSKWCEMDFVHPQYHPGILQSLKTSPQMATAPLGPWTAIFPSQPPSWVLSIFEEGQRLDEHLPGTSIEPSPGSLTWSPTKRQEGLEGFAFWFQVLLVAGSYVAS